MRSGPALRRWKSAQCRVHEEGHEAGHVGDLPQEGYATPIHDRDPRSPMHPSTTEYGPCIAALGMTLKYSDAYPAVRKRLGKRWKIERWGEVFMAGHGMTEIELRAVKRGKASRIFLVTREFGNLRVKRTR